MCGPFRIHIELRELSGAARFFGITAQPLHLTLGANNQWLRTDVIKASAAPNSLNSSDIIAIIFDSHSSSPS